jgi:TM2 domain-containing membrane protein YozV
VKSPGLAAVLSFFVPGVGQVYNGQIAKGLFFFVLYSLGWFLAAIVIGFFLLVPVWIYSIYDGYRTAERINADRGGPARF